MMNKKLSPIEFYWEYTNREASALVHKELYAQHPPSTPDNSSSLGWMKSKRKEKNQMGGKKKKNEWNSILDIRSDTKMATDWKLS